MVATQIDRLKSDLKNIESHARQLKEEGRHDLSQRVWEKRNYLSQYIEELAT